MHRFLEHLKLHHVPLQEVIIQTGHGSEFDGGASRRQDRGFIPTIEEVCKATHRQLKRSTPKSAIPASQQSLVDNGCLCCLDSRVRMMSMQTKRRKTRTVHIGSVRVGGGAPVSVQSMTKTDTANVSETIRQVKELEALGCEIIRMAVPNLAAARVLGKIKSQIDIPLVADIHYRAKLALEALEQGVDALRINPGNITRADELERIGRAAASQGVPVRVGLNSGSVRGRVDADAPSDTPVEVLMVERALQSAQLLEAAGLSQIIISLKASDVPATLRAYREIASCSDYPLHLGVTATGLGESSVVKSVLGIGTLLAEGIGDTLRVSLTAPPQREVELAYEILASLGLRSRRTPEIISCPTCGRCQGDLMKIASEVSAKLPAQAKQLRIAIMGCEVNGPGEAQEADVGIALGKRGGVLFSKGKKLRQVPSKQLVPELLKEINSLLR